MKTCLNCIYVKKKQFEIPCRTCMENDNHDNWTGVDEEELKDENKVEMITRGNCMLCGKELTEGLFFCKKCKNKANSRK